MQEILDAFGQADAVTEKPVIIIAHTVPDNDVSCMEQFNNKARESGFNEQCSELNARADELFQRYDNSFDYVRIAQERLNQKP